MYFISAAGESQNIYLKSDPWFPCIWTIQKSCTAPCSRSQMLPAPTLPEQLLPYQTLPLQTLLSRLRCDGVSDSLCCYKIGAGEKKGLGKQDPWPKTLEEKSPPPPLKNLHGNGISHLKRFQIKRQAAGPGEKMVSSIVRSKTEVRRLVYIILYFFLSIYQCIFFISIDVHFSIF